MSQLTTILSRVFKSWFHEIPLWLLLTIYCMAPAYFNGNIHSFNPVQIIYLFSESIAWTIPLTLLAHKRKWIWWSILTIATALFTIELFCLFNQQSRICTSLIIIALQTNTSEASEFVQNPDAKTALIYSAAISAAILFAAVFFHLKYSSTQHDKIRAFTSAQHHKICIRLLPFILLVVFSASIAVNIFIWNFKLDRWWKIMENSHLVVSPLLYLHSVVDIKQQRDAVNLDKLEQAIDNISVESTTPGDIHIVYVIGESHNRHRSSLYGYFLPTNPQLEKLAADSSLIVFQNAVAYSNSTKDVLCQLLSVQIVNDGSSFDSHPLLPAIFKKAGYHVAYFDNQSPPKGKKFDFSCNYFMSSPTIIDKTFSITNTETYTYDHQLIDNHPPLNTAKSLTIYHLKGQHVNPKDRYPDSLNYFTSDHYRHIPAYNATKRQLMAHYDNACRYQDLLLSQLIARLESQNAILVYLPDHGETIFDCSDHYGRQINTSDPMRLKTEFEIPLLIYLSPEFRRRNPGKTRTLLNNIRKPLINTDIAHTLIDLADIKTPSLKKEFSLLSDSCPRISRKLFPSATCDYDALKPEIDKIKTYY